MTINVIYVGIDTVTINRFLTYFGKVLDVAKDNLQAEEIINGIRGSRPLLMFYEKSSLRCDYPRIERILDLFPAVYIVLVADRLTRKEVSQYRNCGIKDSVRRDVPESRLENIVDFVIKHQKAIKESSVEQKPLGVYEIPHWKRTFDIVLSIIAILALLPFLLIISLLIRIESKGPIIYKSKRVGSNYEVFDFYKFRSMYRNADKRLKDFMNLNQYREVEEDGDYDYFNSTHIPVSGHVEESCFVSDDEVISEEEYLKGKTIKQTNNFVKCEDDPRITRVGRFLRKFSIDELPQLVNILKGNMSFVGNRPLPLYEAEQLTSDKYIDRFLGPAGLTGLWQVEKRGDSGRLSPEERKQLDIYYAKNYNFWMDLKIVFRTFTAFIQKENV